MANYQFDFERFAETLRNVKNGGTKVYEVISVPLITGNDVRRVIDQLGPQVAIWQHTPHRHVAAIYIEKGHGYGYNRKILNLIDKGIDTKKKFDEYYRKNKYGLDQVPVSAYGVTTNARNRQRSYIVADTSYHNSNSKYIHGEIKDETVDRTHLIPAQVTGIENSKGLLIDFDSFLNRNEMNQYENDILKVTNRQDILWTTTIYPDPRGLVWQYLMFDEDMNPVSRHQWIDDRWRYFWYYDRYQSKIGETKEEN